MSGSRSSSQHRSDEDGNDGKPDEDGNPQHDSGHESGEV
jgi:hypothetical protein